MDPDEESGPATDRAGEPDPVELPRRFTVDDLRRLNVPELIELGALAESEMDADQRHSFLAARAEMSDTYAATRDLLVQRNARVEASLQTLRAALTEQVEGDASGPTAAPAPPRPSPFASHPMAPAPPREEPEARPRRKILGRKRAFTEAELLALVARMAEEQTRYDLEQAGREEELIELIRLTVEQHREDRWHAQHAQRTARQREWAVIALAVLSLIVAVVALF